MLHPPSKRKSEQGQLTPVERARVRTGSASAATRARMEILARNYEIAIENLTSHLLSFPEDFNALNCRIAAYKRAGRLENALEDAKALQRLNPGSAKSYIWMAEIHLARRQYEKASEALVFALANVSDKSQLYWRLQELAFIVSRRRFDFLHTVPNEILTCILSQLSIQDRITLLDVSKAWRQYLNNWIDFCGCTESRCEASLDQEYIVEYLKKGGRGIRRCFLFTDALDVIEKEYIVKNQCCYIEELTIEDYPEQDSKDLTRKSLTRTLEFLSSSLTSLSLEYCSLSLSYIMEVVLDTCTNLTQLRWATTDDNAHAYDRPSSMEAAMSEPTKLEYICMDAIIRKSRDEVHPLELLLRRCPKLRHLELRSVTEKNEPDLELEAIRRYCPFIQCLHYHDDFSMTCNPLAETMYPASLPGLRELCINCSAETVVKLLKSARYTLQSLSITTEALSTEAFECLSTIEALERLHIKNSKDLDDNLLETWSNSFKRCLSACHNLRVLDLCKVEFVTDDVLLYLQHCKMLRELNMLVFVNPSDRGILRLVNSLPNHTTIRIHFSSGGHYDRSVLQEISAALESRGGYFRYD